MVQYSTDYRDHPFFLVGASTIVLYFWMGLRESSLFGRGTSQTSPEGHPKPSGRLGQMGGGRGLVGLRAGRGATQCGDQYGGRGNYGATEKAQGANQAESQSIASRRSKPMPSAIPAEQAARNPCIEAV